LQTTAEQQTLADLAAHPSETQWVEHGFEYHKTHGLTRCLLCNNVISQERFSALGFHFSDAVNKIAQKTSDAIKFVDAEQQTLIRMVSLLPRKEQLVPQLRVSYEAAYGQLAEQVAKHDSFLPPIKDLLEKKRNAPATALTFNHNIIEVCMKWLAQVSQDFREALHIIEKHQKIAADFRTEQDQWRTRLKAHLLAEAQQEFREKNGDLKNADDKLKAEKESQQKLSDELETLQAKMRDSAAAADVINRKIAEFLRHKQIKIVPVETGYRLTRMNDEPIVRLSEGEKTAITFCYFLATLRADYRQKKDLLVVVDDPISSLDTQAMNYMAALIKTELKDVGQLFILTHTLPFMTEMRKWIAPLRLIREASDAKKETPPRVVPIPLYQIYISQSADGMNRTAALGNMHRLIRDYESEYHYLYSVIYTFSQQKPNSDGLMYLLPNAMRRVLETVLSFKQPGSHNLQTAIDSVQKSISNKADLEALKRFIETESHGDSLSPLTEMPRITIEEGYKAATALLDIIGKLDPEHKKTMDSLSKSCPALG